MTDPFAHFDGAYVLGALEPDERMAFEQHLETCPDCRARVDELRPTVGLLAAVRATGGSDEGWSESEPVPDTLLPGLLRKAARERSRRRWLATSVGLVAAACLVALVVVLWPTSKPAGPTPLALHPVRATPVHATAVLVTRKWGTEIDLKCRYDAGVVAGLPYELRVLDKDGETYQAGTWTLVPGRVTDFTGGAAVRRDRIAKVQVTLPDGTPILQLAL